MKISRLCFYVAVATMLAACGTPEPEKVPEVEPGQTKLTFEKTDFLSMPLVADWKPALNAFKKSCTKMASRPGWSDVCAKASVVSDESAEAFFKSYFTPYKAIAISRSQGQGATTSMTDVGKMTGYYEPILYGSRVKKAPYIYPLHTMPADLITVDLADVYPQLKGMRLRGQLEGNRLVPYDTRAQLNNRNLDRYAIAWVEDPVAAFFLQIQGSGRIVLPDGSYMRVGYGDVNGHPYRGIGNYLIRQGWLDAHELSMQNIQAWARKNPKRVQSVLNQNPSYVFFVERKDQDPAEGPIGAQGVPLTDKGSVAIDRRFYEMGWPLVVDVEQTNPNMKYTAAVVTQDTGGAIRGPIRFDFYWGSGDDAALAAGRQNSRVKAWVLFPQGVEPREKSI